MVPQRLDGADMTAIADRVSALYRRCYRLPPWSESPRQLADYHGKLLLAARRTGFTALTLTERDRLLGVCYGWPMPDALDGDRVHDAVVAAFGPERAAALVGGSFTVAELFVDPGAQGRGVGRGLLEEAVRGRRSAWLLTYAGSPAARLYRRLGWRDRGLMPADMYEGHRLSLFTLGPRTSP
ncbi:GNAT family N-acetyltransferase [Actinomadura kijaniata]|uniref:GNAT family N-acetyltransferase n=1 Tax=Actinomadura kijaniata TaxID=46161 RepID=UPI00082B7574|nr:GNAT family N-acetyltransferase [Actinomadura kijaniata]